MQKIDQQEFRIEKVIKRKGDKSYVKWEGYDNSFNRSIDKKRLSINVSHVDLKTVLHVDVSSFALKSNLASLKTEKDKLEIDKLTPVPDDLVKLSNVVKNDVVKKTEYNKLVEKIDNIVSANFVLKTKY